MCPHKRYFRFLIHGRGMHRQDLPHETMIRLSFLFPQRKRHYRRHLLLNTGWLKQHTLKQSNYRVLRTISKQIPHKLITAYWHVISKSLRLTLLLKKTLAKICTSNSGFTFSPVRQQEITKVREIQRKPGKSLLSCWPYSVLRRTTYQSKLLWYGYRRRLHMGSGTFLKHLVDHPQSIFKW